MSQKRRPLAIEDHVAELLKQPANEPPCVAAARRREPPFVAETRRFFGNQELVARRADFPPYDLP